MARTTALIDFNCLALAPQITAFGQPVIYRPGGGPEVQLLGIFNKYATEEKISTSGEMRQVAAPTLTINTADLPRGVPIPCRNETVLVAGEIWQISEPVPDNFGGLVLKLKRATQ